MMFHLCKIFLRIVGSSGAILASLHKIEVLELIPGQVRELVQASGPSSLLLVDLLDFIDVLFEDSSSEILFSLGFVRLPVLSSPVFKETGFGRGEKSK